MRCPSCGSLDTQVKDSRPTEDSSAIRRRRVCLACQFRFTTFERVQLRELVVIKRNGRRVPFDRDKLMRSVQIALRKRTVDPERVEQMVSKIVRELESLGESEITTETIGETGDGRICASSTTSPMCASPRSTGISASRRTFRTRSTNCPARKKPRPCCRCASERGRPDDLRFMQLALTLGRRGLGNTWPNPAVGAVVVKDGVVLGRGWTQPGGRPHAETEALRRAGAAARGRDPLRHARALLASRQDAALRRRHHRGRYRARGLGDRGSQSGSRGPRRRHAAGGRDRGDDGVCAERGARAIMPAISAAFSTVARMSRSSSRSRPTARPGLAGRQACADHRRGDACARASDAGDERRDPDRHRHRAGRRSGADLPVAGHGCGIAGAGGAGSRLAAASDVAHLRTTRQTGARSGCSAAKMRRPIASGRLSELGVIVHADARRARAGSICTRCCRRSRARGITRLMVEGGPKVSASLLRADLVDEAASAARAGHDRRGRHRRA